MDLDVGGTLYNVIFRSQTTAADIYGPAPGKSNSPGDGTAVTLPEGLLAWLCVRNEILSGQPC